MTNNLIHKPSDIINKYSNNLPRCKKKYLYKNQCHKSWPDIYKTFNRPKIRRSLSFDAAQISNYLLDYSDKVVTTKSDNLPPKVLDVNYEQLLNDDIDSNKHSSLNINIDKKLNPRNLPRRVRRKSKLFTLPLRTLEESDADTLSNISDGSKTLTPYDEFTPSKFMGISGLESTYFPGQDLFKFLSSGQFVQANAELDRENAHFKISEAIIGTIEQVCTFYVISVLEFVKVF